MTGSVFYPGNLGVVFFKNNNERIALNAAKVQSFLYYDSIFNVIHKFVSLKSEKGFQFYEVVIRGQLYILRKCRGRMKQCGQDKINSYLYFILFNGNLMPAKNFRKRVLPELLEEQAGAIQTYIDKEKLDPSELTSIILIAKEYNRMMAGHQNSLRTQSLEFPIEHAQTATQFDL
jgi:hypothetical protein